MAPHRCRSANIRVRMLTLRFIASSNEYFNDEKRMFGVTQTVFCSRPIALPDRWTAIDTNECGECDLPCQWSSADRAPSGRARPEMWKYAFGAKAYDTVKGPFTYESTHTSGKLPTVTV